MSAPARRYCALFTLVALAAGCNGLVGNESVSEWDPGAAGTDASRGFFDAGADESDAPRAPDASDSPGDASSAMPTDAGSAASLPVGTAVEIASDYSGTCVDVGSTKQSGSAVTLTACQSLAEQLMVFRANGASYSMFNPNSGKCIGIQAQDGGISNDTGLELQSCSDASTQTFDVEGEAGAYVFVWPAGGTVCMDDEARGSSIGTPVVVYSCNSGPNQAWSLKP